MRTCIRKTCRLFTDCCKSLEWIQCNEHSCSIQGLMEQPPSRNIRDNRCRSEETSSRQLRFRLKTVTCTRTTWQVPVWPVTSISFINLQCQLFHRRRCPEDSKTRYSTTPDCTRRHARIAADTSKRATIWAYNTRAMSRTACIQQLESEASPRRSVHSQRKC